MVIAITLGPERRLPVPGCPGFSVRVNDDLRQMVVFFGFADATPGKGGINCVGTGFLLNYEECGYLVTAKHLADGLGKNPFVVRVNRKDGTSDNLEADDVDWVRHPDPNVDVAVAPLAIGGGPASPYQALYFPQRMMATNAILTHEKLNALGVGDLTYTIGLFRLMSGERRNLPVVHSGTVAMVPGDELIPVRDWRDKRRTIKVEGYLVETHAIQGLSGSPVFVRPTTTFALTPPGMLRDPRNPVPPDLMGVMPVQTIFLLGLWSGSWDAPPDEVLAVQAGRENRVPVGMGIVVPAQKIEETLQQEELVQLRKEIYAERAKRQAASAATTDSAIPTANPDNLGASGEENPHGLEDFRRLVDVAARKRPQGDQT